MSDDDTTRHQSLGSSIVGDNLEGALLVIVKQPWLLAVLLVAIGSATATAQSTTSTTFCVNVPASLAVVPPASVSPLIHDGTDAVQAFATQTWGVLCNDVDGASITLDATTFVNGSSVRDTELSVSVVSADIGSGWSVGTASDTTSAPADVTATVQLSSSAPGAATLGVNVSMHGGQASTLSAGSYCAVITATLMAN